MKSFDPTDPPTLDLVAEVKKMTNFLRQRNYRYIGECLAPCDADFIVHYDLHTVGNVIFFDYGAASLFSHDVGSELKPGPKIVAAVLSDEQIDEIIGLPEEDS